MRLLAAPVFDDRNAIFFCEERYLQNWAMDIHEKLKEARTPAGKRIDSGKIVSLFVGSSRDTQIRRSGPPAASAGSSPSLRHRKRSPLHRQCGPLSRSGSRRPIDKWVGDVTSDLDEDTKALIRFGGFLQSDFGP